MSEHIDQLLAKAESTLAALQTTNDQITGFALQFGRQIGEIGRTLTSCPEIAHKVRAFVERTASTVERDLRLARWINSVDDASESRSSNIEDYSHALHMRSDLEFFRDLYRNSVARDRIAEIETDDMDQDLAEWGAHQHVTEVPPGIPESHVWWHQNRRRRP